MTDFIHKILKNIALLVIALPLIQCVQPVSKLHKHAQKYQLQTIIFENDDIPLKGFINHADRPAETVYIYLEGDGRPWDRYWPSKNPNTHHAVSLPLMTITDRDALYLSRPCYGWTTMPPNCTSGLWTSARYSEQIVNLLNDAIDQHKLRYQTHRYIIVGYSGGATLALLLGAIRIDIQAVISIAGNLNHNAWTDYFGYLPLTESLTIPSREDFPSHQRHWYLIGEQDTVVPPLLQIQAISPSVNNTVKRFSHFSHQCCWESIWPELLDEVEQALNR